MDDKLAKQLNVYLADVALMYIKMHNLHWYVVGKQFKSIHEYFETIYDSFAIVLDDTAEMLKLNGHAPLASMEEYLKVATIKERSSAELSVEEAISICLFDMEKIQKHANEVRSQANSADCYNVVGMLEGHITNYNKTIWFLNTMLK